MDNPFSNPAIFGSNNNSNTNPPSFFQSPTANTNISAFPTQNVTPPLTFGSFNTTNNNNNTNPIQNTPHFGAGRGRRNEIVTGEGGGFSRREPFQPHQNDINAKVLFVKWIPQELNNADALREHFRHFGVISSLSLYGKNSAFVTYNTHDEADLARRQGGSIFGKPINIAWSTREDPTKHNPSDSIVQTTPTTFPSTPISPTKAFNPKIKQQFQQQQQQQFQQPQQPQQQPMPQYTPTFNAGEKLNKFPSRGPSRKLGFNRGEDSAFIDKGNESVDSTPIRQIGGKHHDSLEKKQLRAARFSNVNTPPPSPAFSLPSTPSTDSTYFAQINHNLDEEYLQGKCLKMCPEKEIRERESVNDVSIYERKPGVTKNDPDWSDWLLKKYRRNTADFAENKSVAEEYRPPEVLEKTLHHICHNVMTNDRNISDYYNFVWDRTRSIRQDFTPQHVIDERCVRVHEAIVRFHIVAYHTLCELPETHFSEEQNSEQLNKALVSLKDFYEVMREKGSPCASEPEFMAYLILSRKKVDFEFILLLSRLPDHVIKSPEVSFAIELMRCYYSANYAKFSRMVRENASYLQACVIHNFRFGTFRAWAMQVINRAFKFYPLEDLVELFFFNSVENLTTFLRGRGFQVIDDKFIPDPKGHFNLRYESKVKRFRSQFIEQLAPQSSVGDLILTPSKMRGTWANKKSGMEISKPLHLKASPVLLPRVTHEKQNNPFSPTPIIRTPPTTIPFPSGNNNPFGPPIITNNNNEPSVFANLFTPIYQSKSPAIPPATITTPPTITSIPPIPISSPISIQSPTPTPFPFLSPPLSTFSPQFPLSHIPSTFPPQTKPITLSPQLPPPIQQEQNISVVNPNITSFGILSPLRASTGANLSPILSLSNSVISIPPHSITTSPKLNKSLLIEIEDSPVQINLASSSPQITPTTLQQSPILLRASSKISKRSPSPLSIKLGNRVEIIDITDTDTAEEDEGEEEEDELIENQIQEEMEKELEEEEDIELEDARVKWAKLYLSFHRWKRNVDFLVDERLTEASQKMQDTIERLNDPTFSKHATKTPSSAFDFKAFESIELLDEDYLDEKEPNVDIARYIFLPLRTKFPQDKILSWKLLVCVSGDNNEGDEETRFVDHWLKNQLEGENTNGDDVLALSESSNFEYEGTDSESLLVSDRKLQFCVIQTSPLATANTSIVFKGTQAILFHLPLSTIQKGEKNIEEQFSKFMSKFTSDYDTKLNLYIPLVVVVSGVESLDETSELESKLGEILSNHIRMNWSNIIQNFKILVLVRGYEKTQAWKSSLISAIQWLASEVPTHPILTISNLGNLLEKRIQKYLDPVLFSPYYKFNKREHAIDPLSLPPPKKFIDLLNRLLDLIEKEIASENILAFDWPIPEFSKKTNLIRYSRESLEKLRNEIRSLRLPPFPIDIENAIATTGTNVNTFFESTLKSCIKFCRQMISQQDTIDNSNLGSISLCDEIHHIVSFHFRTLSDNNRSQKEDLSQQDVTALPWHLFFQRVFVQRVMKALEFSDVTFVEDASLYNDIERDFIDNPRYNNNNNNNNTPKIVSLGFATQNTRSSPVRQSSTTTTITTTTTTPSTTTTTTPISNKIIKRRQLTSPKSSKKQIKLSSPSPSKPPIEKIPTRTPVYSEMERILSHRLSIEEQENERFTRYLQGLVQNGEETTQRPSDSETEKPQLPSSRKIGKIGDSFTTENDNFELLQSKFLLAIEISSEEEEKSMQYLLDSLKEDDYEINIKDNNSI